MSEAKITALTEELKSIHVANVLYWTAGEQPNRAARAEYKRRQDRLREIRAELYGHLVAQWPDRACSLPPYAVQFSQGL
jgi:hypothetical protein